jgi:protein-S-isoprenylcysteine O-methyltransferase Ste14
MIVGCIIAFMGWCLFWRTLYTLCIIAPILIVALVIKAVWEERELEKVFRAEYRRYKKRVGMFFPQIRRAKK